MAGATIGAIATAVVTPQHEAVGQHDFVERVNKCFCGVGQHAVCVAQHGVGVAQHVVGLQHLLRLNRMPADALSEATNIPTTANAATAKKRTDLNMQSSKLKGTYLLTLLSEVANRNPIHREGERQLGEEYMS